MNLQVPPEEFRAMAEPLLKGAAKQLGEQLAAAAESLAEEMRRGYMEKDEAAAYLGIKSRALEDWMRPVSEGGKGVPHFKFGRDVRFRRDQLDAWARAYQVNGVSLVRAA